MTAGESQVAEEVFQPSNAARFATVLLQAFDATEGGQRTEAGFFWRRSGRDLAFNFALSLDPAEASTLRQR